MGKKIKGIFIMLFIALSISIVKAYTISEDLNDLDIGTFISNDSKIYSSSKYSDNEGNLINKIIIQYYPSNEDEKNNQKDKNGNLINNMTSSVDVLSDFYVKKYKEVFGTDFEYDGWIVTQYFYKDSNLNVYLEPINIKNIKVNKYNWYTFREIDSTKYVSEGNIVNDMENGTIVFDLIDDSSISYEFKSKKDESLYFKVMGNLIGEGNVSDKVEVYIDDQKQDVEITNLMKTYKIELKKGKHTLKFAYSKESNGEKYFYLKDLGLIKDLDYHNDIYDMTKLKKDTTLLKEEIYNETHILYSKELFAVQKKNNLYKILIIFIVLVLIIAILVKKRGKKNEKKV